MFSSKEAVDFRSHESILVNSEMAVKSLVFLCGRFIVSHVSQWPSLWNCFLVASSPESRTPSFKCTFHELIFKSCPVFYISEEGWTKKKGNRVSYWVASVCCRSRLLSDLRECSPVRLTERYASPGRVLRQYISRPSILLSDSSCPT